MFYDAVVSGISREPFFFLTLSTGQRKRISGSQLYEDYVLLWRVFLKVVVVAMTRHSSCILLQQLRGKTSGLSWPPVKMEIRSGLRLRDTRCTFTLTIGSSKPLFAWSTIPVGPVWALSSRVMASRTDCFKGGSHPLSLYQSPAGSWCCEPVPSESPPACVPAGQSG